jgi:hypothetical protein
MASCSGQHFLLFRGLGLLHGHVVRSKEFGVSAALRICSFNCQSFTGFTSHIRTPGSALAAIFALSLFLISWASLRIWKGGPGTGWVPRARTGHGQRLISTLVQYLFVSKRLRPDFVEGLRGRDGSADFASCFDTLGCCCMAFGADFT